jgi:hypothetical protein
MLSPLSGHFLLAFSGNLLRAQDEPSIIRSSGYEVTRTIACMFPKRLDAAATLHKERVRRYVDEQ